MPRHNPPPAFPGHDGGVWSPAPCTVVTTWPVGHFAENLVARSDGRVFISLHSHNRIDVFDAAAKAATPFAHCPAPVAGLALDAAEVLWATGGVLGQSPGLIWRVDETGRLEEWTQIPDAVFLNGCTIHPDGRTLLVCESVTGRVLAIDLREHGRWRNWLLDERLKPRAGPTPGANGVKSRAGFVYISVTERNLIFRAPLLSDGEPGGLDLFATDLRADDFAFAASGALLIATHPAQSVMRLGPDGGRATLAGPDQGAVGATACAFGRAPRDRLALYVTTNGGLWAPYQGVPQEAKLLRLEVGEAGHIG